MGKKAKSYRGQRKHYNPCGCFYCTGTDKEDRRLIEEKRIEKETDAIINNVDLYIVSNCTLCNAEINYKGLCEMCYTEQKLNDLD